jgi:hypothetical protein
VVPSIPRLLVDYSMSFFTFFLHFFLSSSLFLLFVPDVQIHFIKP